MDIPVRETKIYLDHIGPSEQRTYNCMDNNEIHAHIESLLLC